jgi:endonuclease/exonuclease/phosphatase family metal-dependent hydrolase
MRFTASIGTMAQPVAFLFWNVGRQDRSDVIARLVRLHNIDLVILAESIVAGEKVRAAFKTNGRSFSRPFSECEAVDVYTGFSDRHLIPVVESRRMSIRRLTLPSRREILLAMAHLPGKLHRSDGGQALAATQIARQILDAEEIVGHSRTVLIGDLNMNPFDLGVVGASALHAVSTRQVASRMSRKVDGKEFRFFYNPMWGHLGDRAGKTAGTYYRSSSEPDAMFWHALDQILVRPDLLADFHDDDVQILTGDGEISFLNRNGIPDRKNASDHLPLLFRIYL